ncbi:MAG: ABC transporter ATP-binding protein [Bryobacteraceae bacterium]
MIEFAGVSKAFESKPVLSAFNLKIDQGERVVLQGPSGCGKTTILRLIAGFLAPDQGSILIRGKIAASNARICIEPEKRGLGYVFQDLALWPHMTVFENIEFPLKAQSVSAAERRQRVAEMLGRVDLDGLGDSYPTRLSGGQQQRVALARALINRPTVILMDEPLSNLDEELQAALTDQILRLHTEFAFTLVYVTHSKEEKRRLATRSILLRGGGAVED